MEWDKFKMAQHFLQRANAIHPEDMDDARSVDAMAQQDLYYDCYMSSFTKEDLIKRLQAVIAGDITMPDEDVDEKRYRETYVKEARETLVSIDRK